MSRRLHVAAIEVLIAAAAFIAPAKAEIIREEEDFLKWLRNPNIEEAAAAVRARLKSRDRSVVMQEEKERAIIM